MNILYDYQAFDMQTHGGVSRCFVELATHLSKKAKVQLGVVESNNVYLEERGYPKKGSLYDNFLFKGEFPCKGRLFDWYKKIYLRLDYWHNLNRDYSIKLLKDNKFDIFHPTFFDDYFLEYLKGKPFVLTIHDMIPELYPQYFKQDDKQILMKQKLAPLSSAIVTVSEHTKQDVVRILNVDPQKVFVIYHGTSENVLIDKVPPYDFPYILYVGDRKTYKNFNLFVRECSKILRDRPALKVVCTGVPFNDCEKQLFKKENVSGSFIQRFVKTKEEFQSLYHFAETFVYPSQYEGFGIPILEAYNADCPVMLNHASCFPEIAKDAAVYFQLTSEQSDLYNKLQEVLNMNSDERIELLKKQKERLKLFSWEKSACQLYQLYQNVLNN